jgi:hypothetical protein
MKEMPAGLFGDLADSFDVSPGKCYRMLLEVPLEGPGGTNCNVRTGKVSEVDAQKTALFSLLYNWTLA